MPTVFIAIQCCQCSTMQVKQRNKSSKQTWVVCNQKQSIRQVFAQGPSAKDLRLFVQSSNTSRQFAHQTQHQQQEQQEHGCGFEPEIVTEFPAELWKKPKLNKYGVDELHNHEPVLSQRNFNKHVISLPQDGEQVKWTVTQDKDDDYVLRHNNRRKCAEYAGQRGNEIDKTTTNYETVLANDEMVEDDIHPDFL